jgi:hypothetical protein
MNWIAFVDAIVGAYTNTFLTFNNTTTAPLNVKVILEGYKMEFDIAPGSIKYPLAQVWSMFGHKKGEKKKIEGTCFVSDIDGLEVSAVVEHSNFWMTQNPVKKIRWQLDRFKCSGNPPFGPGVGRVGPFPGPEDVG